MSRLICKLARLLATVALPGMLLLQPAPAAATLYCHLKKTKDGFVALRAGPSPNARLLAKMAAHDEVLIGLGEKGDWVEVTWYRGDERLYGKGGRRGWAHTKLIDDMCG